jgi:hypothetical protein
MTGILISFTPSIHILLSIEHGPEEAEPFIEKTALRRHIGNIGNRRLLRSFGVQTNVNGFITEIILQPAVFVVARTTGAMPLDLDVRVGLENGLCAVKHAMVEEILVNVCIELCPLVVILLKMSRGIMNMAGPGIHVGHIDLVRGPEI